jgi:hypothetical protein
MDCSPTIAQVWGMLTWFISAALLIGLLKSPRAKGQVGELLVRLSAHRHLDKQIYRSPHNLTLNYKAAMQALTLAQQTQLRDAKRLWMKFRDAACTLLGSLTGSSIDRINSALCFLDMTKQRADDLAGLTESNL